MAKAYRLVGEELLPLARDYVITTPAAGMFTTVEDMGRLAALLTRPDAGPFDPDTVRAITTTQFRHGPGMRGRGFGVIGNIVVGVVGAFLGGWLFSMLGLAGSGLIGSTITAIVGAVVLLFAIGLIKKA